MLMNGDYVGIWKEATVSSYEVLSLNWPGENENEKRLRNSSCKLPTKFQSFEPRAVLLLQAALSDFYTSFYSNLVACTGAPTELWCACFMVFTVAFY